MSEAALNDRLTKIESTVAELEHLCDQLNQVVIGQSEELRRLQQQQRGLASTVETMELERIKSTPQTPPHHGPGK